MGKHTVPQEDLDVELRARGSSLAEGERTARQLNIQLYDSAGRVIPESLRILAEQIDLTVRELTEWQNTLNDQRLRLDLERDVFDLEGPQRAIDEAAQLLKTLAPDLFTEFFAGVDLSDLEAVEAANRRLTRAFLDGAIGAEALGGLLGKMELPDIIRLFEQGLDSAASAANALTASLLNVPQGFKIERYRFDAELTKQAQAMLEKANALRLGPGSFNVDAPAAFLPTSGKTFDIDSAKEKSRGGDIHIEHMEIIVGSKATARELFEQVAQEAKRQARRQSPLARPHSAFDLI